MVLGKRPDTARQDEIRHGDHDDECRDQRLRPFAAPLDGLLQPPHDRGSRRGEEEWPEVEHEPHGTEKEALERENAPLVCEVAEGLAPEECRSSVHPPRQVQDIHPPGGQEQAEPDRGGAERERDCRSGYICGTTDRCVPR